MFNLAISSKTIRPAHPTLQKAIDYVQKIEREFLLIKGVQQTEFDMILSINAITGNDSMRKQSLANITCCKCGQIGHHRKDCPNSAGTSPVADQTLSMKW